MKVFPLWFVTCNTKQRTGGRSWAKLGGPGGTCLCHVDIIQRRLFQTEHFASENPETFLALELVEFVWNHLSTRSGGEEWEWWSLRSGLLSFPGGSDVKESACNAEDLGSIPGLGRFPGEGKSYPLQYSGLQNSIQSMGSQNQTQLSDFHTQTVAFNTHMMKLNKIII